MNNDDFYQIVMAMAQSNLATYKALEALNEAVPDEGIKIMVQHNLDSLLEINGSILEVLEKRVTGK